MDLQMMDGTVSSSVELHFFHTQHYFTWVIMFNYRGHFWPATILVSVCVQSLDCRIVVYHAIVATTTPAQPARSQLSNLPISFSSKDLLCRNHILQPASALCNMCCCPLRMHQVEIIITEPIRWWTRVHCKLSRVFYKEETFPIKGGGASNVKTIAKIPPIQLLSIAAQSYTLNKMNTDILTQFDILSCQS